MTRAILIGLTLLALAGCETVKGAARDLQSAGSTIEGVAGDIQQKF